VVGGWRVQEVRRWVQLSASGVPGQPRRSGASAWAAAHRPLSLQARGFSKAVTDAREALRNSGRVSAGGRAAAGVENQAVATAVAQVFDVVRAMIEVDTMEEMAHVLEALQHACGPSEEYEVVRVKQRFEDPTPAGWSDVFLNVRSTTTGFTAEIQIAHSKLTTCRKGMKGHDTYHQFRGADELLHTCAEV